MENLDRLNIDFYYENNEGKTALELAQALLDKATDDEFRARLQEIIRMLKQREAQQIIEIDQQLATSLLLEELEDLPNEVEEAQALLENTLNLQLNIDPVNIQALIGNNFLADSAVY